MNCVVISSACASWIATQFSTEQRFAQTIETIASIRKYIPHSYIVMWETTQLDTKFVTEFKSKCDLYIDLQSNPEAVAASQRDKSLGETMCMKIVLQYLQQLKHLTFTKWFKISARYCLTSEFKYENWNDNTFRMTIEHAPCYHTTFYSFSNPESYLKIIQHTWDLLTQCKARNIESGLFESFQHHNQNVAIIQKIGIQGLIGADSQLYTC